MASGAVAGFSLACVQRGGAGLASPLCVRHRNDSHQAFAVSVGGAEKRGSPHCHSSSVTLLPTPLPSPGTFPQELVWEACEDAASLRRRQRRMCDRFGPLQRCSHVGATSSWMAARCHNTLPFVGFVMTAGVVVRRGRKRKKQLEESSNHRHGRH